MPLFTPITTEAELPPIDIGFEHVTLDAKTSARKGGNIRPAPFDDEELAKDIAAFANALGGTILVGATEDRPRGVIASYDVLTEQDATETIEKYNAAAKTLCSPQPLIHPCPIPHAGGVVVAVNVWPFLAQLLGVSEYGKGRDGRTFRFPYRVGRHAVWIEPEQHAMFMIPSIRRTIILLESIPRGERNKVELQMTSPDQNSPGAVTFAMIDVYRNVAVFTRAIAIPGNQFPIPPPQQQTIHVALDDVQRVWLNAKGVWNVRLGTGAVWTVRDGL